MKKSLAEILTKKNVSEDKPKEKLVTYATAAAVTAAVLSTYIQGGTSGLIQIVPGLIFIGVDAYMSYKNLHEVNEKVRKAVSEGIYEWIKGKV